MAKQKLVKHELYGGPFDGIVLAVPPDQETIMMIDGHSLHRYDIDEVYEGNKIRPIYRHAMQIPVAPEVMKKILDKQKEGDKDA